MLRNSDKILKNFLLQLRRNYKVVILNTASLAGIVLLGINIYRVLSIGVQRYRLISTEEKGLERLKEEEEIMGNDLKKYSSLDFIESQSRDFLSLARDGELILVIPNTIVEEKKPAVEKSEIKTEQPSIDLWFNLLF